MIAFIQTADAKGQCKGKEHCWLANVSFGPPYGGDTHQIFEIVHATTVREKNSACFVNIDTVTYINRFTIKTDAKNMVGKRVLDEHVVAVDPGGVQSGSHSQAAVNCRTLAAVRFAHPKVKPRRIFFENFNSVVRTSAVENNILEVEITLKKDRPDCLLNKPTVIEGWSHDRNAGQGTIWRLPHLRTLFCPRPTGPSRRGRGKFC